ncbi:MAG: hypothetical protein R6V18_08885 [Desulfuromonadaceae bacterium]
MKRIFIALALMLSMAAPAFAVDFTFNGDLNHRFRLYTNQATFFNSVDKGEKLGGAQGELIEDETNDDLMGEIKYRLWTTASSDNGAIKGTYAVEVGGIQFGDSDKGGSFSGDGVNIETRWAFTDFALGQGRARIGLMPVSINKFFWVETATGVDYKVAAGPGDLTLGWYRGYEVISTGSANDFEDLDALYVRYDLKPHDNLNLGFFGVWQHSDAMTSSDIDDLEAEVDAAEADLIAAESIYDDNPSSANLEALNSAKESLEGAEGDVPNITHNYVKSMPGFDMDLYTLGVDGNWKSGDFFARWDLMSQFGDLAEEYDFGGYFGHFDAGMHMGKGKLTYTFWYASGDDDATDGDWDAFVSTDVDINSEYSVVLFEGYTDDDYFSASPYLQDKGLILNRLGYDYQVTDKLKVGAAALYLMTAEDIEYNDNTDVLRKNDKIGVEFDAYASYKLFSNTEVALQAGYLAADDAMDYYEVESDGSADEDIYIINSRIRYMF